jgi:alkyl sulfatase BDS1-like metallo-beta-lactamase superfamily hydrolase
MGGIAAVTARVKRYQSNNNLRFAATLLSHAWFGADSTDPEYAKWKSALADVLEQLGFGVEYGPWRKIFLVGSFDQLFLNDGA